MDSAEFSKAIKEEKTLLGRKHFVVDETAISIGAAISALCRLANNSYIVSWPKDGEEPPGVDMSGALMSMDYGETRIRILRSERTYWFY